MFGLGWQELLIIFGIILLLFGPGKLPQLGKALGDTITNLRKGIEDKNEDK